MHRSNAVTSASIYERKFAEKLTILNQRGKGIIIRVFNIKKVCTRAESNRAYAYARICILPRCASRTVLCCVIHVHVHVHVRSICMCILSLGPWDLYIRLHIVGGAAYTAIFILSTSISRIVEFSAVWGSIGVFILALTMLTLW